MRVKVDESADAVADRMISTFNSRNDRNSAELKGGDVDLPADLPRTVETLRHSFLESDFWSLTVRSQNSFSFVLKRYSASLVERLIQAIIDRIDPSKNGNDAPVVERHVSHSGTPHQTTEM